MFKIKKNLQEGDTHIWNGPFSGYIKGTPINSEGMNQTIFCRSLEEAKKTAEEYNGIVGGITKINDTKYSLRFGHIIIASPKNETSWLLVTQNTIQIPESSHGLPEDEEKWTDEQHKQYEKWESSENKKWCISNMKRKEDKNEFHEWIYNSRVLLLNPFTDEVRDRNTNSKIGKRMVLKYKKNKQVEVEVLVWSVTPYFS